MLPFVITIFLIVILLSPGPHIQAQGWIGSDEEWMEVQSLLIALLLKNEIPAVQSSSEAGILRDGTKMMW